MNAKNERRTPQRLGNWIPILLSVLIAICGISGTWAVYGYRIAQAEEDVKEVAEEQKQYVTKEILELTLKPIELNSKYTSEAVARLEQTNWEILKQLKARNDN